MSVAKRKEEQIEIAISKNPVSLQSAGFEDVILMPKSLPELKLDGIDTRTTAFGKNLDLPFLISPMTGGTERAMRLNALLAKAANHFNIAIGVGSQKAMINHGDLASSYVIRKYAPNALLIGNIGIDYLTSDQFDLGDLASAIEYVGADALYVHINTAQELSQPEGARSFVGAKEAIKKLCRSLKIPVLAKEVGHGLDPATIKDLASCGVKAFDVAGVGGTSWAYAESFRSGTAGETFRDWGLPTCLAILLAKKATSLPIIASGGICNGLQMAKSIALGASLAGMASPLLKAAVVGEDQLFETIEQVIYEFKSAMLLSGAKSIAQLKKTKYLLKGDLKALYDQC